jgi:3-deoxy-D-manno-octulosonate 8-phosphate phosphatase (KDO 8-P phosphatase)
MTMTPKTRFKPADLQRAKDVKVVFFDVDGVLTDGGLWFSEAGETLKRFHTLDGHGLKLLQRCGVTPVIITGRDSGALRNRLGALGVLHAVYGTEDKLPAAQAKLAALGLDWSAAAAMGDDWPDLPMLRRALLACVPASGHPDVLAVANYVPQAGAGCGAVRELCDLVLTANGAYPALLDEAGH